jgi:hypothetical protein
MNKIQSSEIASAIDKIVEGLNMLKSAVEALVPAEKPESLCDKFKAEFEASRPKTKPVQLKLPLPPVTVDRAARLRLGDIGYENEVNPNRQACGQLGGLATAGVKRAPSPDRRKPGTVMVKNMSVNEKRRYWRWSKFRAAQRSAGVDPVSWAAWVGERG